MDLNDFNLKEATSRKVELTNPANEAPLLDSDGNPVWIEVHGADSDVYRNAMRFHTNRKMAKKSNKQTMEEVEAATCKILAASTVGWSGLGVNGQPLEFSEKAAEKLYLEHLWIREQVDAFINERANFLTSA